MTGAPGVAVSGWVGGYTHGSDGGIGRLVWDEHGIRLTAAVSAPDPSFLALAPDGETLYAVHELEQGRVAAYAVDGEELRELGSQPTGGDSPCHVAVHPDGGWLAVANYGSGSVSVHPTGPGGEVLPASDLVQHSGSGPVADRQEGPHAHQVVFADGDLVLAVDLGIDAVITYRLDRARGSLTPQGRVDLPPGTGPRHLALNPRGHAAYVVGELDSSFTTCRWEGGTLEAVHRTSVRPAGSGGDNFPAAVLVAPGGKQVRVSNRGEDTIATLALNGGGLLARLVDSTPSGGSWPRDLAQTPDGARLLAADERAGLVVGFEVTDTRPEQRASARWPAPTCVVLDRAHSG